MSPDYVEFSFSFAVGEACWKVAEIDFSVDKFSLSTTGQSKSKGTSGEGLRDSFAVALNRKAGASWQAVGCDVALNSLPTPLREIKTAMPYIGPASGSWSACKRAGNEVNVGPETCSKGADQLSEPIVRENLEQCFGEDICSKFSPELDIPNRVKFRLKETPKAVSVASSSPVQKFQKLLISSVNFTKPTSCSLEDE